MAEANECPRGSSGFSMSLTAGGDYVGEARDLDFKLTATEIEDTSIDTNGWRSYIPGLKEASIEFLLLRKTPESAGANKIRRAFLQSEVIRDLVFVNDLGYGWKCDFVVNEATEDWKFDSVIANRIRGRVVGAPIQVGA